MEQYEYKPLTQEQIEAEAGYADKIYRELGNVVPKESLEKIKLRKRSKTAGQAKLLERFQRFVHAWPLSQNKRWL